MRIRGDDHVRSVHATRREPFNLAEEHIEVDHDTIADHRDAVGVQDARWQQVQGVALAADHHRVAGVVAA